MNTQKHAMALTLVACCVSVWAQPASAPRLATKEEYRSCVLADEVMTARKERLDTRGTKHSSALAQLQKETAAYMAAQQKAQPKTRAAVESYNSAVGRFNARASDLEREQAEILKEQAAFNSSIVDLNSRCAGQVVTLEIREEVTREREAKAKE